MFEYEKDVSKKLIKLTGGDKTKILEFFDQMKLFEKGEIGCIPLEPKIFLIEIPDIEVSVAISGNRKSFKILDVFQYKIRKHKTTHRTDIGI